MVAKTTGLAAFCQMGISILKRMQYCLVVSKSINQWLKPIVLNADCLTVNEVDFLSMIGLGRSDCSWETVFIKVASSNNNGPAMAKDMLETGI